MKRYLMFIVFGGLGSGLLMAQAASLIPLRAMKLSSEGLANAKPLPDAGTHYPVNPPIVQKVTKTAVPGIANFARLGTTVACAGTVDPDVAMPAVKQMGFAIVVNLREASEPGADVEAERTAADRVGLRYAHLPLNPAAPDPKIVDQFLALIAAPENQPAFIHCASGNRAAAMWMIKRLVIDHWTVERAVAEAAELGLTSPALRQFALDYARGATR